MSEQAHYCHCLNTYTISQCGDRPGCDRYDHWEQGIEDTGSSRTGTIVPPVVNNGGFVKSNGTPLDNEVAHFDGNDNRITGDPRFTYDGNRVLVDGVVEATSIKKTGGLGNEFLMADGTTRLDVPTYTHDQGMPSNTWLVPHQLNKRPSVTVVDSGETVVSGQIEYLDNNNIMITFNAAFSGKAYLN